MQSVSKIKISVDMGGTQVVCHKDGCYYTEQSNAVTSNGIKNNEQKKSEW